MVLVFHLQKTGSGPGRNIQILVPQDYSPEHSVHSIPDYVLGWLIHRIAEKKGNNIVGSSRIYLQYFCWPVCFVDCCPWLLSLRFWYKERCFHPCSLGRTWAINSTIGSRKPCLSCFSGIPCSHCSMWGIRAGSRGLWPRSIHSRVFETPLRVPYRYLDVPRHFDAYQDSWVRQNIDILCTFADGFYCQPKPTGWRRQPTSLYLWLKIFFFCSSIIFGAIWFWLRFSSPQCWYCSWHHPWGGICFLCSTWLSHIRKATLHLHRQQFCIIFFDF